MEGKRIPIYGTGNNVRDWIHVEDHCKALLRIFMNGQAGAIYNIGGRKELSNLQVARTILKLMNCDEERIEFIEDRKGHDFRYSVNDSRLRVELGFESSHEFEKGLKSVIEWYIKNEIWWRNLKYL